MPTLLKIWKTENQEWLARKAGAARTSASYSIPEDEDEKQHGHSIAVAPRVFPAQPGGRLATYELKKIDTDYFTEE